MRHKGLIKTAFFVSLLMLLASFFVYKIPNLKLGHGFARELNMVFEQPQVYDTKDIVRNIEQRHIEVFEVTLDEQRVFMRFSGVDDVETFLSSFINRFPGVEILTIGTFGSLSNITNSIKIFQIYISVFLFSFIVFFTYRYRALGLLGSLFVTNSLLGSLYIANKFGFLLNNSMWMVFLISFIVWTINLHFSLDMLSDKTNEPDDGYYKTIIISKILLSLIFTLSGLAILFISKVLLGMSVFLLLSSVFALVDAFIIQLSLKSFFNKKEEDTTYESLFLKREPLLAPHLFNHKWIYRFLILLTIFTIGAGLVFRKDINLNPVKDQNDYSQNAFLVVDESDASSFLEVQASLGKYNLINQLIEYRVSEEKTTWYRFNKIADYRALQALLEDVESKINSTPSLYRSRTISPLYKGFNYNLVLGIIFVLSILVSFSFIKKSNSMSLGIFLIFNQILLWVYNLIFMSTESFQTALIFIISPLVIVYYFWLKSFEESIVYNTENVSRDSTQLAVLFGFIVLPVLMIIPDPDYDIYLMARLILVAFLSFIGSEVLCVFITQILRGLRND